MRLFKKLTFDHEAALDAYSASILEFSRKAILPKYVFYENIVGAHVPNTSECFRSRFLRKRVAPQILALSNLLGAESQAF